MVSSEQSRRAIPWKHRRTECLRKALALTNCLSKALRSEERLYGIKNPENDPAKGLQLPNWIGNPENNPERTQEHPDWIKKTEINPERELRRPNWIRNPGNNPGRGVLGIREGRESPCGCEAAAAVVISRLRRMSKMLAKKIGRMA